ncbi:MAG TPA: DNA alkylation repair protein [Bacteroidetes bacterium]|nr:DNA alkylation repair protein [Bacteroidota bacterium]
MLAWSKHESLEVRRFSTEGMRSRLPWAAAVPTLKKNPAPILPILENLKQDPADWVRLSVSNNLNDISKDHPELAKKLARSWYSLSPQTGKLVKHGLRTLLKKGDAEALRIIGVADASGLEVSSFAIENPRLRVGEDLWFTFSLKNTGKTAKTIRLEYGVYYMKANGTLSRKVFKLSEGELAAGAVRDFRRKQHFRPISTRKYHGGEHRLSIIVNGEEKGMEKLELLVSQE